MTPSVALPSPTPPSGGRPHAGVPPADPARQGSPFAGLLGEQRLALARGGRDAPAATQDEQPTGPEPATAPDGDAAAAQHAAPAGPAKRDDRTAEVSATDPRTEPLPVLDWLAQWQPDAAAAVARGLPAAGAAASAAAADGEPVALAPGDDAALFAGMATPSTASEPRGRAAPAAARSGEPRDARLQARDLAFEPGTPAGSTMSGREPTAAQEATPSRADATALVVEATRPEAANTPPQALLATAGGPVPAGAVPVVTLATPLHAPDFSQALAAQLTTLAREGVHEARLQLNPAEMGPIAVQIVVDGSQAQVDFAAAHAGTRQALEASLPTLAAALQTLGLTLSGGGVFEQGSAAREGRHDDHGPRGPRRNSDADDAPATSQPVVLRTRAGLLDLYA